MSPYWGSIWQAMKQNLTSMSDTIKSIMLSMKNHLKKAYSSLFSVFTEFFVKKKTLITFLIRLRCFPLQFTINRVLSWLRLYFQQRKWREKMGIKGKRAGNCTFRVLQFNKKIITITVINNKTTQCMCCKWYFPRRFSYGTTEYWFFPTCFFFCIYINSIRHLCFFGIIKRDIRALWLLNPHKRQSVWMSATAPHCFNYT